MIEYADGPFGIHIIFRLHGSAILKALVPAALSTLILVGIHYSDSYDIASNDKDKFIDHPYAIGALLAAFSFLIVFRANFAYARYWDAAGHIHQMHSKWTDLATTLAAFHLQSSLYDEIRPPSFGHHEELHNFLRERELNPVTPSEMRKQLDEIEAEDMEQKHRLLANRVKRPVRVLEPMIKKTDSLVRRRKRSDADNESGHSRGPSSIYFSPSQQDRIVSLSRLDGGMTNRQPALFLQEFSHLLSLLSAVALSTLRRDEDRTEIPLLEYVPGVPFPPVDPDQLSSEIRAGYYNRNWFLTTIRWLLGVGRNKKQRSLYNAARPFRVIGGVSDGEMRMLCEARGPLAKVSLASLWLQEFITREHLAGSTDGVAAPIISRLYQYCSDGMLGYNQARKIAYIPFPFPSAQVTTLFVAVIVVFLPVLTYSFVNSWWLAYVLNFFTVLCFTCLHMVARELENPFQNVPNDLPLTTFQAEFNEALVVMFAGFNPDAWWEMPKNNSTTQDNNRGLDLGSDLQEESSAYGSANSRHTLDIEAGQGSV